MSDEIPVQKDSKKGDFDPFVIVSPYPKVLYLYNNNPEDTFPDVQINIPGAHETILLHRALLGHASIALMKIFHCNASKSIIEENNGDSIKSKTEENRVDWQFGDEEDDTYRHVFEMFLRFCYGDDLKLKPAECGAAIAVLTQLELDCKENVLKQLEELMINATKEDLICGKQIVSGCVPYRASWEQSRKVAKEVFTLKRMKNDGEKELFEYLMDLPQCFVSDVEYGCGELSEFQLRLAYISRHSDMNRDEKQAFLNTCDFSKLNGDELNKLHSLNIISEFDMIKAYACSLANREKELNGMIAKNAELKARLEKEEQEKEELKERAQKTKDLLTSINCDSLLRQSTSFTSGIDTGEASTHDGGAVFDDKRKIILSVSGNYNNGRNIRITRMVDEAHGDTTTQANVIPFGNHGQYPVYDGKLYTYFFQSEDGGNNRFGRLNMDTLTFEELPPLPSNSFREFCSGCFHNENIYILDNNLSLCEFCVSTRSWKTLPFVFPSRGRLMDDPSDPNCIYCLFEGRKFSHINLVSGSIQDLASPPVNYQLSANRECYLHRTEAFGFFVFATFPNRWYGYLSLRNSWIELPNWSNASDSSAHFVVISEGQKALFHVSGSNKWEMVQLPFI